MGRARFVLALLLLTLVPAAQASAGVNDFTISNFSADYYLGRDSDGRSTLKTIEVITAQFPDYDQNHGIERELVREYDGHKTSLDITSVKKSDNLPWNYTSYNQGDFRVLRIGDADTYVRGTQTYQLTYTQRDVTKYFQDVNDDEFYWDTNGTGWKQSFSSLSVAVHIESSIAARLNGNASCYQGYSGATETCSISKETGADGQVVFRSSSSSPLSAGENVTLAIGFKPGTFQPYQKTTWEKFAPYAVAVWSALWLVGFALIFYLAAKFSAVVNRKKELNVFPPEYIPPKDVSVTTAASVVQAPKAVFAAQLLDFAVRHYIKLYQIEKNGFLGFKGKDYEIEVVRDIGELKAEEQEILRDIFGGETGVGSRLKLSSLKNNTAVYKRTVDNDKKLKKLVRGEYGLRSKDVGWSRWFRRVSLALLLLGLVTLSPFIVIAALFAFVYSFTVWVLTDKGLELSRYLKGLKMYIEMAEKDRLNALQSPEGTEKVGRVDVGDNAQLVKLYERVLPYAVLFGQEKEWNKHIGELYEANGAQPDWYSGRSAFNAAAFGTAMHSFSSAASYSAASSSSSGGSSGGGSSGGGGGGGGGGGW